MRKPSQMLYGCRFLIAGFGFLSLICGGGCASSSLSQQAQKVKGETYETVYTLGSHIPKRVVRGTDTSGNDSASPVAVIEGDKARDVVRTMQRRN